MRKPASPSVRHALKKARTEVMSDEQVAPGANVLPETDEADADAQNTGRKERKAWK